MKRTTAPRKIWLWISLWLISLAIMALPGIGRAAATQTFKGNITGNAATATSLSGLGANSGLAFCTAVEGACTFSVKVIGTDVQAYSNNLTIFAGITPSANVQSLLGAANYAAVKGLLNYYTSGDSPTFAGVTLTKSSGVAGDMGLYEANSTDTHAAGFRGPASISGDAAYRGVFPNAGPSGAGFMGWAAQSAGSGTAADPYLHTMSFFLINTDLAAVSANHDTVPSAKAVKNRIQYKSWSFDPKALCDGAVDRLFLMSAFGGQGIIVTQWKVSFEADPTTEADLDLKRADAWIGVANAAVMDVLDTTTGAASEATAANINGGAAVAEGKAIYLEFGTAYTEANHQMIFEMWFYEVGN